VELECQAPVVDLCCGEDHSLLVLADSTVWVWGRGTQAALGLGAHAKTVIQPQQLPSSGDLKSALHARAGGLLKVAAGASSSCVLHWLPALPNPVAVPPLTNSSSWQPVPIHVAVPPLTNSTTNSTLSQVCVPPGGGHSRGGHAALYTWGANKCGELGHGDVAKRAVPRLVKGGGGGVGGGEGGGVGGAFA